MRKKMLVVVMAALFVLGGAQASVAVDHEHEPFDRVFNRIGCLVLALEGDPSVLLATVRDCVKNG